MRTQEIDYQKVAKVAEKVKQLGKESSLTNVCEQLGIVMITPNLPSLLERW